ncbi:MAG: tetratricopeptide repeat protein [Candidatus Acidiferrales bacterium]
MRKALLPFAVAVVAVGFLWPAAGQAQKRETIELQRDVALLRDQVRELQRSHEENTAVLKTLLEQTVDAVNRMQRAVASVEKNVQEAQANTNLQVDALSTQVQSLRDTVDELRARLGQISQQVEETRGVLESVDARLAPLGPGEPTPAGAGTPAAPGPQAPPSADVLYSTALRDFIGGKYDLARQEFADYLKYYSRTQLAGNAQFYIADTYYHEKDYQRAISEYDKVFESFPNSYKIAAAQLKKAYALLELDQRQAGVQILRTLMQKFPGTEEAKWAEARLERLGEKTAP